MSTSFKFVFTATRDPEADAVQLAEVVLYDTNGSPIEILTASNPGGSPPVCPVFSVCQSEMPDMAVDGNIDTHWTDYGEGCYGRACPEGVPHTSSLVLSLVNNSQVGSYKFVTASDRPHRDPVAWTFGRLLPDDSYEVWSAEADTSISDPDMGEMRSTPTYSPPTRRLAAAAGASLLAATADAASVSFRAAAVAAQPAGAA